MQNVVTFETAKRLKDAGIPAAGAGGAAAAWLRTRQKKYLEQ